MSDSNLSRLLRPQSVGVVGIPSQDTGFKVGGAAIVEHLNTHGYSGAILPVSRSRLDVGGAKAYPSILDLPYAPDCIVIAVPASGVEAAIDDALNLGTRAFVILSAGFGESGEAGRGLEESLAAKLRAHSAVAMGPNTTGFINLIDGIALSSTSRLQGKAPPSGSIGLIVQSGALSSVFLDYAADNGIGLSYVISTGNEMLNHLGDYMNFLVDDDHTRVIGLYVEGFRFPAEFIAAARRAAAKDKPIIVVKVGQTEVGRKAAASHTGSLTGSPRVHRALFRQLGITVADSLDDMLEIAVTLSGSHHFGRKIAVATISGGLGGLMADSLMKSNVVSMPAFAPETASILKGSLEAFLDVRNPLDVAGAPFRRPGLFGDTLIAIAKDPGIDSVVVALTPVIADWCEQIVEGVMRARRDTGKAFAVLWQAGVFCEDGVRRLRENGVPVFNSTTQCAAVLSRVINRPALTYDPTCKSSTARAPSAALPDRAVLDEAESKKILAGYLPGAFAKEVSVAADNPDALIEAARTIGYPVVLKAMMEGNAHKSELGLVALGIFDQDELRQAAVKQLSSIGAAGGVFKGFLIAEFVHASAELLVGVTRDEEFGPVMTVGAGGIYTELFDDVSIRVLPVSDDELHAMIDECKVSRILHGMRGKLPLDIQAVIGAMKGLCEAAFDLGETLNAIEINPLAVLPNGGGVRVLDAKIFLGVQGDIASRNGDHR